MTEEERDRIAAEATEKANTHARVTALEGKVSLILKGLGVGAAMIAASIWDKLSGGIFR
jgi:hypothetical protein